MARTSLSFLFSAENDVLVPVLSRSTTDVVVNFVVVLKFPILKRKTPFFFQISSNYFLLPRHFKGTRLGGKDESPKGNINISTGLHRYFFWLASTDTTCTVSLSGETKLIMMMAMTMTMTRAKM